MTNQLELHVLPIRDMQFSGVSFLRSIQNPTLPLIDLFVRESVQNSLDAAINVDKTVEVEIKAGKIHKECLLKKLNGIDFNEFENDSCDFIYVKDSGTTGLTGPLKITDAGSKDNRNLRRLIYEIGNTHSESDEKKGGSWGYGKTVFFNLGKGIVIYYSRSKENNEYREILTVSLAEKNNNDDFKSVLKKEYLKNYTGIAWWDKKDDGEECSYPLTDPRIIKEIISIFNIKQYTNEETGTCIIIPFLRTDELIETSSVYKNGEPLERLNNLITLSLWKWYFPRLTPFYKDGAKLNILNRNDSHYGVFVDLQKLYIAATNEEFREELEKSDDIHTEEIYSTGSKKAGTLAFKRVFLPEKEQKKIYDIFFTSDDSASDNNINPPIMLYSRRFGMIVDYSDKFGSISIPSTDKSAVLLAYFISNSDAIVDNKKLTVESYIRQCEKSDHNYWDDHVVEIGNKKKSFRFIRTFQKDVRNKLADYVCPQNNDMESELKKDRSIQQELGKLFLPPIGYGSFNSAKPKGNFPNGGHHGSTSHQLSHGINTTFFQNEFDKENNVIVKFRTEKSFDEPVKIKITLYTKTVDKVFSAEDWEVITDSSKKRRYTGTAFPAQILSLENKGQIISSKSCKKNEKELAPYSNSFVGVIRTQKNREEDWIMTVKKSNPAITVVIKVEKFLIK